MACNLLKFKKGDKVVVVSNESCRDYEIGKTYVVKSCSSMYANYCLCDAEDDDSCGGRIKEGELKSAVSDLEMYEARITEGQLALAEIQKKIDYMKLSGVTTFNTTEFKVWQVLTAVETMTDKLEKTKAIASLIDGK